MEKIDLRHSSSAVVHTIKQQVVNMKKRGCSLKDIAENLGISYARASYYFKEFKRTGGISKQQTRGRKYGESRVLSSEQEIEIQEILIDKRPDQMKLAFMLWTRKAIRLLIMQKYNIDIPLRTVTDYLKRWGMTCQRPTKKAYFQDNIKVERFKKVEYSAIKARSIAEKAEIYWCDETKINNREHYYKGFAPKGKPPTILVESKLERINMISAINNYGTLRFSLFSGSMNQQRFIKFLKGLVSDAKRKVFLITDNLKVHHGKIVAEWLTKNRSKIELFFIPPYSPELNPVEYLNHSLKRDVHGGMQPRKKAYIERKANKFMKGLQNDPTKVIAFFHHINVAYQMYDIYSPQ
jgi:transposase